MKETCPPSPRAGLQATWRRSMPISLAWLHRESGVAFDVLITRCPEVVRSDVQYSTTS